MAVGKGNNYYNSRSSCAAAAPLFIVQPQCTSYAPALLEPSQPVAWKPAPRGDQSCPEDCNGVGNCNHDTGLCECPAGWIGQDCKTVSVGDQQDI
jgi:hypothetical protein